MAVKPGNGKGGGMIGQKGTTSMKINVLAAGCVLLATTACNRETMPGPDAGAMLFAENCTACHGITGTGDGPLADELPRRPPDLTTIAARNGGTFPRAEVMSTIDGYSKGTNPGRVMPEFGALMTDAELVPVEVDGTMTPTPRPLAAVLAYLESIQQ
ncbi:cytochrome c [Sulfitobacter sp. D35]|uniref:c-type cytochrome n=1 Tax=Sulfitobacter sp. D35 TaxID=3083252 RepID=UPI00296EDEC3|nr:cytochrome c [Sulfitobacter sp. D35]MDW4499550.1 cytochrome c [Sulfitobacter sp. D35]